MQYSLRIWEERVREERMIIRIMTIDDYDQVWHLWSEIKGFGIRTLDDVVIIPAFGVPTPFMDALEEKGVQIVDTTCGDVPHLGAAPLCGAYRPGDRGIFRRHDRLGQPQGDRGERPPDDALHGRRSGGFRAQRLGEGAGIAFV